MTRLTKEEKVVWGKDLEQKTKQYVEKYLGYTITPTEYTFDSVDFTNTEVSSTQEVKGRPKMRTPMDKTQAPVIQYSTDWDTWMLPYCKIEKHKAKKLYFFYYWESENSLWVSEYDAKIYSTFRKSVPADRPTKQLQIYIPKKHWVDITDAVGLKRIPIVKPKPVPLFITEDAD